VIPTVEAAPEQQITDTGACFECGQSTSGKQANTGQWWCIDCAKAADEQKNGSTGKPRRQPKSKKSATPKKCSNCHVEDPSGDGPFPTMCKTCADRQADAQAATH
jgi:hypothetical protein